MPSVVGIALLVVGVVLIGVPVARVQKTTIRTFAVNSEGYPLKAGHRYTTMVSGL